MRISGTGFGAWLSALSSPMARYEDAPTWAHALGVGAAVWQFVSNDTFVGALILLFLSGVFDYIVGVKAARFRGEYDPKLAHAGAMGKMSGILILFLIRGGEFWSQHYGVVNTHGALSTAIAVSLFAVDLQSIAHHREGFGAAPIPVLGAVIEWLQTFARGRVGAGKTDDPRTP